jgi:uncharacterized protein YraI
MSNRHMLRVLFSLSLLICLFTVVTPILAQDAVASVATGSVNVRSGPGLSFGAITTLPYGFGVQLVARNEEANWVYIRMTNGVTGWININYLYTNYRIWDLPVNELVPATPLVPTGTVVGVLAVNVRNAPDPNAGVVTVINLGQQFELIGRNFNTTWAQIRLPSGQTGWLAAENVNGTVPVRALSPTDGSVVAPLPGGAPVTGGTGNQGGGARVHVVAPGETLSGIAARYGVNLYTLAQRNGIANLNIIYSGQRLSIP